jgi:NAD(P)-dependent dehydrogenase (short-subunit alcohol dehydrogenase family)
MDLLLKGKIALVTGSTAGIGLAIAKGLARENATVIVNGRSEARAAKAVEIIQQEIPKAAVEPLAASRL